MSIPGSRPQSRSATVLAVTGAKVSPIWPCPKACTISGPPLENPITGRLSGIDCRNPIQLRSADPSSGNTSLAPFSNRASRWSDGGASRPPSSTVPATRNPQPTSHRTKVKAPGGRTGGVRQARDFHVPFKMIAALGIQRHPVPGHARQKFRICPCGDYHLPRLHLQAVARQKHPAVPSPQPIHPRPDMRQTGGECRHHPPGIIQEHSIEEIGSAALHFR